jgi:glucose-1-phosphate adenylyltransferase
VVWQNRDLIAALAPKNVLVTAGDHVYAMDYFPLLEAHEMRDADATVSCVEVSIDEAQAFEVAEVDARMRLRSFVENPERPKSVPGREGVALGSMGVYVFETAFLLDCLEEDARDKTSPHDFGLSILPRIAFRARVYAHVFGRSAVTAIPQP